MKRPHDLGGTLGHGPIDTRSPPFAATWEKRMWAVAKNTTGPDWTLDWWRHMVERLEPETYLAIPYFEKWCLTYMTGFITSDVFTAEEVIAGSTAKHQTPPPPSSALQRLRANEVFFDLDAPTPAAFTIGDTIKTRAEMTNNHTRLPGYAMGKTGEIIAHHGAHVFADLNAEGTKIGQHLYTVAFTAHELWGPDANPTDSVTLDLWESYFDPA